jgi:hypothetical protein
MNMNLKYTESMSPKESFFLRLVVFASMVLGVIFYLSGGLIPMAISQFIIFTTMKRKPIRKIQRYLLNLGVLIFAFLSVGIVVGTGLEFRPI